MYLYFRRIFKADQASQGDLAISVDVVVPEINPSTVQLLVGVLRLVSGGLLGNGYLLASGSAPVVACVSPQTGSLPLALSASSGVV